MLSLLVVCLNIIPFIPNKKAPVKFNDKGFNLKSIMAIDLLGIEQ